MMRISQFPAHKSIANGSINFKKSQDNSSKHIIKPVTDKNSEKKSFSNELSFEFTNETSICNETGPFQENDWLLLDCSFGIPLFDGNLNKKVCERLLDEKLCNSSSLRNLIASSRKLCLQILEFISKNQPLISGNDARQNISFLPNRPGCDTELPLPTANLMFCDGKLSIWDQFSHR